MGNGWQFGEREGLGRLAVCVNQEPWQDYCVEPPCGQLNPVNEAVYEVLDKLYQDFFELFDTDMFHMGGDEVNLNCWNTTKEIRDELRQRGETGTKEELLALWKSFQEKAAQKVDFLSLIFTDNGFSGIRRQRKETAVDLVDEQPD